MEHKDINEVLRKDMNALNTLTQVNLDSRYSAIQDQGVYFYI